MLSRGAEDVCPLLLELVNRIMLPIFEISASPIAAPEFIAFPACCCLKLKTAIFSYFFLVRMNMTFKLNYENFQESSFIKIG